MSDWGFPVDMLDVRMIVASYLKKQKRVVPKFTKNIPGDDWARNFMKRWNLSNRLVTVIKRKRAKITREELEKYFSNLEKELDSVPAR